MAKTLLLADDSVTIQKVVGISFASEDVDLITVDNGDDAIARAREARPDVVLADVVMPGKNGYEVCEAIKTDPATRHIPVLLLTGTFEAFDEERANQCGAAGHVAKPFEAQTLVDRVKELLASPPPAAPAPPAPDPRATVLADPLGESLDAPDAGDAEGFDFFDDDLSASPAAQPTATPIGAVDLTPGDSAFAFGDDDLGATAEPVAAPAAPAPDSTVAILGDDADLPAPATDLDAQLAAAPSPDDTADDLMPASLGTAGQPAAEDFDFEIGDSLDVDDSLAPVGGDDLAQETVLDPKGASGFDVSSSDLGNPLADGPARTALLEDEPVGETLEMKPPAPPAPAPDPDAGFDLFDEPERAPAAAPAPPPPPAEETVFQMPSDEPDPFEVDESSLEELVPPAPSAPPPPPEPVPLAMTEPEPAPPPLPPSVDAVPLSAGHDASDIAGVALAEIEPRLREQIHDTLEKVAWESFGDVTEQIVRQALERVERIAWEVIPQMAETLIREEIRKMKGEE